MKEGRQRWRVEGGGQGGAREGYGAQEGEAGEAGRGRGWKKGAREGGGVQEGREREREREREN